MYKIVIIALIASIGLSCSDQKSSIQEIEHIMQLQTDAWNAKDIEGFMQPYWHSDSLRFMGKSGVTLGWQATLQRYKKNYHPNEMGVLHFTELHFDPIDADANWVDGRWTLYREKDTLSGHFSLLWKRIENQWQIVADHSS
ncbi:MAG: hypothetical protein RL521_260 [Bacteroidota bacterium]